MFVVVRQPESDEEKPTDHDAQHSHYCLLVVAVAHGLFVPLFLALFHAQHEQSRQHVRQDAIRCRVDAHL